MDILVAEDDNLVSLEEALAFIDGCDSHDQNLTDTLAGLVPMHNSPVDLFSQITPSELLSPKAAIKTKTTRKRANTQRKFSESSSSQDEKSTKKQRTRSAASSSTRLQQRKRAELQALREQAQELETQVELLKKNKFLPGDVVLELDAEMSAADDALLVKESTSTPPSNWHEMAIAQYKERLVSEKTNRRLKSILANQEKVNGALSGLLQKRSVLNGMDYVLSAQVGIENTLLSSENSKDEPLAEDNKAVLTELEERVQRLYKEFKSQFTATSQSLAITCDMKVKQDPIKGKMIEFITSTPMSCCEEEASEIMWKELTMYRDYPYKTYNYMKGAKPNTHEKNFVMNVRSPSGMVELNGLQFMQRFEEEDRTVFIIAERMTLPAKGAQFRDECWITVTPSESTPNTSVVEIFLKLYMDQDGKQESNPEDTAYAQNVVMSSLSNTFRKCFQTQQNMLMEKAGRVTMPCVPTHSIAV
ncbi:hypothetical protein PHMEG_00034358 [Phytophthora megakarya]|uniref:M96 mating-specific protein n=1 Tax=Phytophthora megakarya TaxID=4795 RepID=A0A225USQ6_9STRA|nr:hypothetical protein PHMEG_00034358 [Phytophthora megakarya]